MLHVRTSSLAQTHAVAAAIARLSRSGDVLVLAGEMGAGKTAFAQGFGAALGVTEPITSPTFNLVHSYAAGRITLHHADVYRLATQYELADLALGELAEDRGIVLVEWGDVVAGALGDHLAVHLETVADDDPVAEAAVDDDAGSGVGAEPAGADDDPAAALTAAADPSESVADASGPVVDPSVVDPSGPVVDPSVVDASGPVVDPSVVDPDLIPDGRRTISITGVGRSWATRWSALETALKELAPC